MEKALVASPLQTVCCLDLLAKDNWIINTRDRKVGHNFTEIAFLTKVRDILITFFEAQNLETFQVWRGKSKTVKFILFY